MDDGHVGLKNEKREEISVGTFQTALSYLTLNERIAQFVIHVYSTSFDYSPGLQRSDIQDNGRKNFLERLGFEKCEQCNILPGQKCYYSVIAEVERGGLNRDNIFDRIHSTQPIYTGYRKFANDLEQLFEAMTKVDEKLYTCGFELPYNNLKLRSFEQAEGEKVYYPGMQYALYTDLSEIFKNAKKEVLIIEAYPDEELINLYVKEIQIGVKINVLIGIERPTSKTDRDNFISVAGKFSKLPQASIEVRESDKIHDRLFIVDGRCWVLGSSIKDAATKKPTYLISIESAQLFQSVFDNLWSNAIPITL